ncbi:MAG: zinc ABC transporter substrate-binding protein [Clostridia bacterium]|nr:zinc ABC transporter substrate-binding protein [Clostridia bacterium]
MKKLICALLALCLMGGCLCAGALAADERPSVVTAIFPQYDFVRAIAGDRVALRMLLKPGAEVHTYEPAPQDIMAIDGCDLFVYSGGESDEWAASLLAATENPGRRVFRLMDCVPLLEEEGGDGEEAEYDEHVWTSPKNAMLIVSALCDTLCEIDPAGEAVYRANAAAYLEELARLDAAFEAVVAAGERDTIVFGDRFPLLYFVQAYGLHYLAAFPGCSTETEPSAATMAALIRGATQLKAPLVLYLELSNGSIARAVAEQVGAGTRVFYACHNLTQDDFEAGRTYLDFMWENVDTLREALGQKDQ